VHSPKAKNKIFINRTNSNNHNNSNTDNILSNHTDNILSEIAN